MTNYDRWKLATPDYLEDEDDAPPTNPAHTAYPSTFHQHVPPLQGQRITDQGHHQGSTVGLVHFDGQGRILGESRNEN